MRKTIAEFMPFYETTTHRTFHSGLPNITRLPKTGKRAKKLRLAFTPGPGTVHLVMVDFVKME